MHSIRTQITALTIVAIITTVLAVFGASYSAIRSESEIRSVETMNLMVRDTQKSLEKYLESIEQAAETAANITDDTLDGAVLIETGTVGGHPEDRTDEQIAAIDEYLSDFCDEIRPSFDTISSRTHGIAAYYLCIAPDISTSVHGFYYAKAGKAGYNEMPNINASRLDPEDTEHNIWYFETVKRGRPLWIGPYKADTLDDMWVCSYVVPVYKAGAMIGVLGMDIPVSTLVTQVEQIRVYETGYACLLDENGRVIYHPTLEIGDTLDKIGMSIDDSRFKQKTNGDELIKYMSDGIEREMAFTTMSSGMKLVITAPTNEINAWWKRMSRNGLATAAIVLLIFATLIMIVMGLMTRPLQTLTAASQRLAAGDYDVELDYSGKNEIGTLTGAFAQMRDRIKHYIEDLNHRLYSDSLTDLPNMRHFFVLAEKEKKQLLEEGKEPSMLFFNLIGMKYFNRQFGFEEGDKLICEVGQILARHYGELKMCRYSDDRFAAITGSEDPEGELDEIFSEIRAANGGNTLPVRAGIYPYSIGDVSVSIACDRAKYASEQFRDTYFSGSYSFSADMLGEIEKERYIISHLDQAIENKWIRVYYQSIVRAETGLICDEEALSRWIDPDGGFLSPADFISVLEKARIIYKLDLYVLDEILEKMKEQMAEGLPVVPHSLNLSRADFESCDIVEEIRRRVDDAGIDRDRLTIEITESMVGSDFDFMKSQVQRFQSLGFQVWMDDFGSGYSSLNVLQDIHFDLLKFDMRFMHRFEEGDESKIIMTELIHMASKLGVETICEGVETKEQVEFLRENGCTKLQGYYFYKPVPFEEVPESERDSYRSKYELK